MVAPWCRIVGTSHIASRAVKEIHATYDEYQPDVLAVELDPGRLEALLSGAKPNYSPRLIRHVGIGGYLFALLGGALQRRLGKMVGMTPGADMLAAVKLAKRDAKRVLLIDREIAVTLRRLTKSLGWREFKQLVKDSWRGLWGKEETVAITLSETPSAVLVTRLLAELRTRYPRPYHVLVEERNRHMARALKYYHEQFPEQRILVVVGAGHVAGLTMLLEE